MNHAKLFIFVVLGRQRLHVNSLETEEGLEALIGGFGGENVSIESRAPRVDQMVANLVTGTPVK